MQVTTKNLDDGSLELTVVISAQETEEYKRLDELSSTPQTQFLSIPNPFERKAKYCVTCSNGHRETIEAYGDIHAFTIARSMCGAGFGIYSGECSV